MSTLVVLQLATLPSPLLQPRHWPTQPLCQSNDLLPISLHEAIRSMLLWGFECKFNNEESEEN